MLDLPGTCAFDRDLQPSVLLSGADASWEVCKGSHRIGSLRLRIPRSQGHGGLAGFLSRNKRIIVTRLRGAYYAISAYADAGTCALAFVATTPVGGVALCGIALWQLRSD